MSATMLKRLGRREHPTPAQLSKIREHYGLTQSVAARICFTTLRTWQNWEKGDGEMHGAIWCWFLHELEDRPTVIECMHEDDGEGVCLGCGIEIPPTASMVREARSLLRLAQEYANECGECGGAGIDIQDADCAECKFIRDVIARAGQ